MVAFHCSSQTKEGSKIAIQIDQPVEVDHDPHQNHDHASADFYLAHMWLEPLQYAARLVQTETEEEKGKAHAERVKEQQRYPLSQGRCSSRDAQNRAEEEADAGRPADGENDANQQRGGIAGTSRTKSKPFLPVEKRQFQHTCQVQTNDDEQNAANLAQLVLVYPQKTSQGTGRRAQCDESQRKTTHEHDRMKQGHKTRWTTIRSLGGLNNTLAHELREIDGNQWQHARREKRNQPGGKGKAETQL